MNFKKTSAIVLAISFALIVLASEFSVASERDENQARSSSTDKEQEATRTMKETYMGVDANDKEAVEKRMRELSLHKWREMFGTDTDIEDVDFSLDFSGGLFDQAKQKVKNALEVFRSYIKNRRHPTTTPEPSTST